MSEPPARFEIAPAQPPSTGQGDWETQPRVAPGVSIFATRPHLRTELFDDVSAAGLRIVGMGDLTTLLDVEEAQRSLGDIVLVDCPDLSGAQLAALVTLDARIARSGSEIVVSTSLGTLDDVFGALELCAPQILVEPTRAERVVALGRAMARAPRARVRELSDEDRMTLLRLTEQVSQIAAQLDRLGARTEEDAVRSGGVESPRAMFFDSADEAARRDARMSARLARAIKPPLPDPRLVRRIIRQRQLRSRHFDGELFADPAWDILLDLTAARAEHQRVSVTSLCIASGVPPTTALRWIGQMTDAGLLLRVDDEADRRRAFIALSDATADAMARYFHELGNDVSVI